MKKLLFFTLCIVIFTKASFAQKIKTNEKDSIVEENKVKTIQDYKGQFIFDGNLELPACDAVGNNVQNTKLLIPKGAVFSVYALNNAKIVIKFNRWRASSEYAKLNEKYFLIDQTILDQESSEFIYTSRSTLTFGTLVTPFRLKTKPFTFNTNVSIGAAAYLKKTSARYPNVSNGFVLGLSLSSVTLDSASTSGTVMTNTDRPAITPSLSYIVSYKAISFTIGIGFDFISRNSTIEKSWVYHGKPWMGIGIGVSLFSENDGSKKTTEQADKQRSKN